VAGAAAIAALISGFGRGSPVFEFDEKNAIDVEAIASTGTSDNRLDPSFSRRLSLEYHLSLGSVPLVTEHTRHFSHVRHPPPRMP